MAARKGIVSPWLGASKNIRVAGKMSASNTGSSEAQIDTGGGERDKVNETLMLGIAGAAGVTAAAIGARRSGLPQRFANTITNKKIVVHATGNPVEGKYLRPVAGSPGSPDKPVVFSWSTDFGKGKTGGQDWIVPHGADYGAKGAGQQNYVIGKTSRKNTLGGEYKDAAFDAHPNPVKIVKIVQNPANDLGNFVKQLKTAGVKTDANFVTKILEKKAAIKYSNSLKKSNKKSVM